MENLREIRKSLGLAQHEVAREVGVSLNAYIRWEQGVGRPNKENEKKLREVLTKEEE